MSTILKFPITELSKQRLHNLKIKKAQNTQTQQKIQYTPVYLHGMVDIYEQFKDLNDTLKYVTDGLYAIAIEIKEIKGCGLGAKLLNFCLGWRNKNG